MLLYNARVMFVIAKSAVSQLFANFINTKMLNKQLEQIIVDKCYTVLQLTKKFRPKVLQLRDLISQQTQVICLTATLLLQQEPLFMLIMDIEPSEVHMI